MANLGCEIGWLRNQLKPKLLGTPMGIIVVDYLQVEDLPVLWLHLLAAAQIKERRECHCHCLSAHPHS